MEIVLLVGMCGNMVIAVAKNVDNDDDKKNKAEQQQQHKAQHTSPDSNLMVTRTGKTPPVVEYSR